MKAVSSGRSPDRIARNTSHSTASSMTAAGAHWCGPENTRTRYGKPFCWRWRRTIMISDREEVKQFVLRFAPIGRISSPVRDDACNLALETTQCHYSGHAGAARESASICEMAIQHQTLMRVLPDRIHALRLVGREIS